MRSTSVMLWRWRRNPLKRRSDIVEAWVALVTLFALLVAAPLAGFAAGAALDASAAHQRADAYRTTAVLQQDSPVLPTTSGESSAPHVQVPVRWTTRGGAPHTGMTLVTQGLSAGTRISVWTDRGIRLVPPPPSPAQGFALAVTGGIGAAAGVSLLLVIVWSVVRMELDRLRMDEWAREWADKGPRWSHGRT